MFCFLNRLEKSDSKIRTDLSGSKKHAVIHTMDINTLIIIYQFYLKIALNLYSKNPYSTQYSYNSTNSNI